MGYDRAKESALCFACCMCKRGLPRADEVWGGKRSGDNEVSDSYSLRSQISNSLHGRDDTSGLRAVALSGAAVVVVAEVT